MTGHRRSIAALSLCCTLLFNLSVQTSAQSPDEFSKPDDSVSRELKNDEPVTHRITLVSGQFAQLIIQQHDHDLVAKLFGPDGKQLAFCDGTWDQREPISLIAAVSGSYRLEVHAISKNEITPYELKLAELRPAVSDDEQLIVAERLMTEAKQLVDEGSAISLRQAAEKYEASLIIWRKLKNRFYEAKTLAYVGYVYQMTGDKQKGLDYLKQALPISAEVGDKGEQASALHNIGFYYSSSGDPLQALEYYRQALPLWRVVENRGGEATTLNTMGWAFINLGEPQEALNYFAQAQPLRRAAGDKRGEGFTLEALGSAYGKLGDMQKALEFLGAAQDIFQSLGHFSGQANVSLDSGEIYASLGENQKAIEQYQTAVSGFQKTGFQQGAGRALEGIAGAYTRTGELQKALEYHDQALTIARAVSDRTGEASALVGLGWTSLLAGDGPKAIGYFTGALEIYRATANQLGEAGVLYGLARAERDVGQLSEARAHIETAINLIETFRSKVASQNLRVSYLASKQDYYDLYIEFLMQLGSQDPNAGHEAEALSVSERAKARSLLDVVNEAHANIRHGVDSSLLEREHNIQQQLNVKTDRLTRLLLSKHTDGQAGAAKKELETLLSEYQEVEAQIRAHSPLYAELTRPVPLNLKQIQTQVLDDDTLLLEYSLGEGKSFLWAVTTNSIKGFELPKRTTIEVAARSMYDLLTARSRQVANEMPEQKEARIQRADAAYPRAAADLSEIILRPVASELSKKRLVVVSDGALQYVPFAALPIPDIHNQMRAGSSRANDKQTRTDRPLIIEHEVVNLPSVSVVAALRKQASGREPANKTVAVLADPVFSHDDSRVTISHNTDERPVNQALPPDIVRSAEESGLSGFARLRFSRLEANEITNLAPAGQKLQAVDFAANRLTATGPDLSKYHIVHFATHGLVNSQHPEFSGIVLSLVDEKGQPQNGFLRLYEIYDLRLRADLVVLSACQTALGKEIKGEGLIGLTRGFMYAGAPRVVASLWRIEDRSTAELMKRFYQGMLSKQKLTAAAALRSAQIEMWKQPGWKNPYYWAAFTLQGEWR